MADALSLQELIAALTGAVTEAQDAIQQHQLGIIARYFNAEGRPWAYALQIPNPSSQPDAAEHRKVVVPLLSIVEPNLLAISEFTARFRVELGNLEVPAPPPPAGGVPPETAAAPAAPTPPAPAAAPAWQGAPIEVPQPPPPKGSPQPAAPQQAQPAAPPPATPQEERAAIGRILPAIGPAPPQMAVGLASGAQTQGPLATLSIRVVSRPVTDGMSRLINTLNKTI